MKRIWGSACKRVGSYTKWVGMVILVSVLTGCADDLGPPDDVATVKGIIGHFVVDPLDRTRIHVAVNGSYAISSWRIRHPVIAEDDTTFLKKNAGKWKILGTDYGWISYCDLKKFGIPEDEGGSLVQFIWRRASYRVGGQDVPLWKLLAPLDPKESCNEYEFFRY